MSSKANRVQQETPLDPTAEMDAYLRDCVKINPEDMQEEFVRIPADLAYWNGKYAQALREHLISKLDRDVMKANLEPMMRQELMEAGAKITEAVVKAAIESNETMVEAERRVVEAEVGKNEVFGYLDAIRSKKEMLISLGAHLRAEMEGDPMIREQARSRKVMAGD